MQQTEKKLKNRAKWLRKKILDMTVRAGAGHIAPSFSCADILIALYHGGIIRCKPGNPKWNGRDRFILSKGQAAVALYAVLADLGFFPVSELKTFTQCGSFLGGHTENTIPGVEAFTGSLGHGLSLAAGIALAARIDRKRFRTYVLLGDGECHEGSVWEAAMFAGEKKLDNLIAIVDVNGLSATDHLSHYLDVEPFADKWRSFGWDVSTVDGHSISGLLRQIRISTDARGKPSVILARTTKGKGVSFMEDSPIWHYRIPVGKELEQAKKELDE